jgi:hypothetical protein
MFKNDSTPVRIFWHVVAVLAVLGTVYMVHVIATMPYHPAAMVAIVSLSSAILVGVAGIRHHVARQHV